MVPDFGWPRGRAVARRRICSSRSGKFGGHASTQAARGDILKAFKKNCGVVNV